MTHLEVLHYFSFAVFGLIGSMLGVFFNDSIKAGRGWELDELVLFVIVLYFMVYLTLFLKTLLLQGGYFIFFYLALYNYHSSFRCSLFLEGDLSCIGCLLFFTLSLAFCYHYYYHFYY